ncbi:MAG: site-specific integrase [Lachnospiraceae bacterium]|nr:site-specific integrase [Clostridiales bacterium]MBR3104136.1 site-specific integrase [Lachnospiraceae bacterium]MBR6155855.1 site-specific integrase [Lachnospiraceae bacterium]
MADRKRGKKKTGISTYTKKCNGNVYTYYMAHFDNQYGKRVQKSFKDFEEAERWLIEEKHKDLHSEANGREQCTAKSQPVMHCRKKVDEVFEDWLTEVIIHKRKCKYNTIRIYRCRYEHRIQSYIGDLYIDQVTSEDIERIWIACIDKNDANGMLSKVKYIIVSLIKEARRRKLINTNPLDEVEFDMPKGKQKERRVLSQAEQRLFEEKGTFSAHYDEFVFALHTGLRCGELSALKWSNINWAERKIRINGTLYWDNDQKCFRENSTKTEKGQRTIPLDPTAYKILCKRRDQRKVIPLKGDMSEGFEKYVFLNKDGEPTRNTSFNRSLTAITKRIGIDNLTMHCLRHTFATRWIENKKSPKVLQAILGHADFAMTMNLYVHTTEEQADDEMKTFVMF